MENMFIYTVEWHDCDRSGEYDSGIEYRGSDRKKALDAKRNCDATSFYGTISIEVVGHKEFDQKDAFDKDSALEGPNINVYADGTYAFDGCCNEYELYVYEEIIGHGKPIRDIPYEDFQLSKGDFAKGGKAEGVIPNMIHFEVEAFDKNK